MRLKQDELENISDWISLNYDTLMSLHKMYESGSGSAIRLLSTLQKI